MRPSAITVTIVKSTDVTRWRKVLSRPGAVCGVVDIVSSLR